MEAPTYKRRSTWHGVLSFRKNRKTYKCSYGSANVQRKKHMTSDNNFQQLITFASCFNAFTLVQFCFCFNAFTSVQFCSCFNAFTSGQFCFCFNAFTSVQFCFCFNAFTSVQFCSCLNAFTSGYILFLFQCIYNGSNNTEEVHGIGH